MKENTRTQSKHFIVRIKKTLHLTTAMAFFLQQLVPYSSAFAMSDDEGDGFMPEHTTPHSLTIQQIPPINDEDKKTFDEFLTKAENGDAEAQCSIGVKYSFGRGVIENKKEAVKWYTLAAEQGYADAVKNLKLLEQEVEQRKKTAEEAQRRLAIPQIALGHEDVYERFLKGRLIYKPNKENDVGKIELRIADLASPLEGEFDLSKCGDTAQYLSINTGYRKSKRPENKDKVEIWFSPHFLIEKNLAGSASHFMDIIGSWDPRTAPVGTFFTWGNCDVLKFYDYATNLSWESYDDPENNLRNIYASAHLSLLQISGRLHHAGPNMYLFHVIFSELEVLQ